MNAPLKYSLLKAIKENSNNDGWCTLTGEKLSELVFYNASNVNKTIRELQKEKIIVVQYFKERGRYRLTRKIKVVGNLE